jgi:hypothetical protein
LCADVTPNVTLGERFEAKAQCDAVSSPAIEAMSATESTTEHHPVSATTLRVRRHRQPRRERLPTVELPNEVIHAIITRGLIDAAQRADVRAAIQDCYAALKRLSELD